MSSGQGFGFWGQTFGSNLVPLLVHCVTLGLSLLILKRRDLDLIGI